MTLFPHDLDSERLLLSTLCSAGAEQAALECTGVLQAKDFYAVHHQLVFNALVSLLGEGTELNAVTLHEVMLRQKTSATIGGFSGLIEIIDGGEVAKPMVLVNIIQGHRKRRDLLRLGNEIILKAQDGSIPVSTITEEAGSSLSRIVMHRDHNGIRPINDISESAFSQLEKEFNGFSNDAYWIKGWSQVNNILGGFRPGQLIILAARPGVGKTALAMNWVLGLTSYQKAAGIFSLEMLSDRLWRRLVSSQAGIDLKTMIEVRDQNALRKVRAAKDELDRRGIWIQDRAEITPREIMGEVDGLISRQPNLGLLVVDHLGLISTPDTKSAKTEATRIGEITRCLKILASDRKIPILLLSQLNREVEKRQGGRPQLSDLRDSGCVEQDADVVMFIHRDMNKPEETTEASLIIAKNREGRVGTIPITYIPEQTKYHESERETDPYQKPSYSLDEPTEWIRS